MSATKTRRRPRTPNRSGASWTGPGTGLALALAASLLAACGTGSSGDGSEEVAAPSDIPADPSATSEEQAAMRDPSNYRGGRGRLDTGIDLTSLNANDDKVPPFLRVPDPGQATPARPTPTHGGLPGHISMLLGETGEVDFGKVKQGEKASHTYHMVSDGKHDLVISRFKASCGCTVPKIQVRNEDGELSDYTFGDPIPPGTEFQLQVDLTTDGKPQGQMPTNIVLFSNDPRGAFTLKQRCDVETVLVVEPEPTLQLGQITAADRVEGSLQVRSETLEPFLLTVDERFVSEPLSVELEPLEPDAAGRSTVWDVHMTLGPGIPEGLRNYPILLLTDKEIPYPSAKTQTPDGSPPVYTARAYVQAAVQGLVTANPGFLSFGMVRPGEVVERTVRLECFDDFVLDPNIPVRLAGMRAGVEFPYEDRFTWSFAPSDDPQVLELTLRLEGLPEDLNGSFGGYLHLDVGHPLKPTVGVRFSGVCRQGLPGGDG